MTAFVLHASYYSINFVITQRKLKFLCMSYAEQSPFLNNMSFKALDAFSQVHRSYPGLHAKVFQKQ